VEIKKNRIYYWYCKLQRVC